MNDRPPAAWQPHPRRCWNCGRNFTARSSVAPDCCCPDCGSQDTRRPRSQAPPADPLPGLYEQLAEASAERRRLERQLLRLDPHRHKTRTAHGEHTRALGHATGRINSLLDAIAEQQKTTPTNPVRVRVAEGRATVENNTI